MHLLEDVQSMIIRALDDGPDHLCMATFDGSDSRILAGMKVHANTISHARLVALEETFPRAREAMGHDRFNALSRAYLDEPHVAALSLTQIGQLFPDFLTRAQGEAITNLARFEWFWLEAFHAADAPACGLADLAGLDEEALLAVALRAHPAARGVPYSPLLGALVEPASAILIARPETEVVACGISPACCATFRAMQDRTTIRNLLGGSSEPARKDQCAPDATMSALIALLNAGAVQRVK